jgi:hypothetical protein
VQISDDMQPKRGPKLAGVHCSVLGPIADTHGRSNNMGPHAVAPGIDRARVPWRGLWDRTNRGIFGFEFRAFRAFRAAGFCTE